ncbi:NAD(P)H-dependent oxidoreductase subunit E [Colidextribacter sp. OB.20]|uniref:NADH-quinone oxidoreductase subunit NuoE family protein n=1 Tax=Colidextribacter sp. OB.20 TaxID=2304568 RepID=UPI0013707A1A|nr:NAD(P)H-dependent oxidoreductase subunit E [Colidextribacter sp. OB.20]NBI11587.1 NAD(P)H-dependent oxidoreductase subunit E [Colidextribacter sp. OB.20]
MPNCKTVVPYRGTQEQEDRLRRFLQDHKGQPGAVMPVLQEIQSIFGYLPEEALIIAAEEMDISLSELYSVGSFYAQFSFNPKGVHQVSVCLGTACYVKGAAEVLEAAEKKLGICNGSITLDGRFSLDATRCIGACGLAPVMMVDSDVYGRLTPDQVGPILDKYM